MKKRDQDCKETCQTLPIVMQLRIFSCKQLRVRIMVPALPFDGLNDGLCNKSYNSRILQGIQMDMIASIAFAEFYWSFAIDFGGAKRCLWISFVRWISILVLKEWKRCYFDEFSNPQAAPQSSECDKRCSEDSKWTPKPYLCFAALNICRMCWSLTPLCFSIMFAESIGFACSRALVFKGTSAPAPTQAPKEGTTRFNVRFRHWAREQGHHGLAESIVRWLLTPMTHENHLRLLRLLRFLIVDSQGCHTWCWYPLVSMHNADLQSLDTQFSAVWRSIISICFCPALPGWTPGGRFAGLWGQLCGTPIAAIARKLCLTAGFEQTVLCSHNCVYKHQGHVS